MVARAGTTPRDRIGVAARAIAAMLGGYAVAALIAIALGGLLPTAPITATIVATLVALLAMPGVAMACFWARSATRAWAGTLLAAALLATAALAGGWRP